MVLVGIIRGGGNNGDPIYIEDIREDMKKVKLKRLKDFITESDIKNQVKDYFSLKGWFHFPLTAGMGSYKGVPDRIAAKDGRVLFIEVKRPRGKQSENQREFQANIEGAGGEYILVRCLEDLIEGIKEGGKRND